MADISSDITRQRSRGRQSARDRAARKSSLLGTNGTQKSVEPSRPAVQEATWPQMVMVEQATAISSNAGRYNGKAFNVKVDPSATGDLAVGNVGAAAGDVEIWHMPEAGTGATTLREEDRLLAFLAPTHSTRGKPIAVTFPNQLPGGVFVVQLSSESGSNGTMTTPPSWTYIINNLAGVQIAPAQAPLTGREAGLFGEATWGLAFFDYADNSIKLLYAFETRQVTHCEGEA